MKTYVHLQKYLAEFSWEWETIQTNGVETIKNTHYIFNNRLWDIVEKYGTARQATDNNVIRRMRFARWITKATATCRICNTYWSSMATMVTRTRLNVTLYVRCLSCRRLMQAAHAQTIRLQMINSQHRCPPLSSLSTTAVSRSKDKSNSNRPTLCL
jgi:hypothetical protein